MQSHSHNQRLGVVAFLLSLLLIFSASALAQTTTGTTNGLVWSATSGQVTITGFTSALNGTVSIPGTINGLPVTAIKSRAFQSCNTLTSVTIPNSISSIGTNAFTFCSKLTSIEVTPPNSFYSSTGGVLFSGDQTTLIQYPIAISGSYTIPATVTNIATDSFNSASNLTGVTIPNGVTYIGYNALSGCSKLTSVTIPSSVTTLAGLVFYYSPSLLSITVDPANPNYSSVNGVLFDKSQTTLIEFPGGVSGSYTIPTGVTNITNWAFTYCNYLTSVTIPNSVITIGTAAFYGCNGLRNVSIGTGVTNIAYTAFSKCGNLSAASFLGNAPSMGAQVFDSAASGFTIFYYDGATGFTTPTWNGYPSQVYGAIPPTITTNPTNQGVTSGTSITFSAAADGTPLPTVKWQVSPTGTAGVFTDIDSIANPTAKTGTLSLSNVTTALNGYAYRAVFTNNGGSFTTTAATLGVYPFTFASTSGTVTVVKYSGTVGALSIPSTINGLPVTSIGDSAFQNCSSLTSIAIPSTVTSIGSKAFYPCFNLTAIAVDPLNSTYSSVDGVLFDKNQTTLIQFPGAKVGSYVIPNSVTAIGDYGFDYANKLTDLTIPSSVTSIGDHSFAYCSGLTSVTVPSSVATIGNSAFSLCTKLKNAIFKGNAPSMGSSVFASCASGFTVSYFNDKSGFAFPTWNGYTTVNMGDSSPSVAAWLQSNGFSSTTNLRGIPNGDGVSLLMAYALNLDPTKNQSLCIPNPVVSGSNMSLTYYAASADVIYIPQTSTDLQTWNTVTNISGPDANNRYTATVPMSGTPGFMRLKVVK